MQYIHLAGCIIQNEKNEILLLHRNTAKRTQWEIPGGKIDEGEDAKATASREVREELGIDVQVERELGNRTFNEDEYTMTYTWFSATIKAGKPQVMEPETHDSCQFFSIEAMQKLSNELSPNAKNFLEELLTNRIAVNQ